MCIMFIGRPTAAELISASLINRDGAGVAVKLDNGLFLVRRALKVDDLLSTLDEFPDNEQVWHLRLASHGAVSIENVQPIPFGGCASVEITTSGFLAHYGTVSLPPLFYQKMGAPEHASDAMALALYCQQYPESAEDFLTAFSRSSSFCLARCNQPLVQLGFWRVQGGILTTGIRFNPGVYRYSTAQTSQSRGTTPLRHVDRRPPWWEEADQNTHLQDPYRDTYLYVKPTHRSLTKPYGSQVWDKRNANNQGIDHLPPTVGDAVAVPPARLHDLTDDEWLNEVWREELRRRDEFDDTIGALESEMDYIDDDWPTESWEGTSIRFYPQYTCNLNVPGDVFLVTEIAVHTELTTYYIDMGGICWKVMSRVSCRPKTVFAPELHCVASEIWGSVIRHYDEWCISLVEKRNKLRTQVNDIPPYPDTLDLTE